MIKRKNLFKSTRPKGGFFSYMGEFLLVALIMAIAYQLL